MKQVKIRQILLVAMALCLHAWASADTYTYDNLNRLTSVLYSSGPQITYSYDAAGNRTTMNSSALTAPNAFSFTAQANVARSTQVVSNAITVSGINTPTPITVAGGEYSVDGGTYTNAPATISNGRTVTVRRVSAASYNTLASVTLTIGGVSGTFNVTTLGKTNQTIGTISFNPNVLAIGGNTTASATATSNLPVTFDSSATPTICSVLGATITGLNAGVCTITANQVGDTNYNAAPAVTQSITVATRPLVSLNPTSLHFGDQHIGTTSGAQTVVLTNTGGSTLTIASIVVSLNPFDFAVVGCAGGTLLAGASCNLGVSFSPTAAAARLGAVRVTGNATNSPQILNLDGTGVLSNVPLCTLKSAPARISPGRSSTLTANCSPMGTTLSWSGGTCAGKTTATCTDAPSATTTYSVTGINGYGASTASAVVTVKPVDLTPILMLLLD